MMIGLFWFVLTFCTQAEAPHTFQPVDPAWAVVESTLKIVPDAFMVVKTEDLDPKVHDYWLERRYFQDKRERKILRYDPQRRLRLEIDITDEARFTRILRPDGSMSGYQVHSSAGFNAFSVSRDGKTIHRVQHGIGELVSEGPPEGEWTHTWYMKGVYLEKRYDQERCIRVTLQLGSDTLLAATEGEELFLTTDCEHWTNRKTDGIGVQIVDSAIDATDGSVHRQPVPPKTDIRPIPHKISRRPGDDREILEIKKEWAVAWPKRRAGFITRYGEALKTAGQDWERLGIDFIRSGTPWPY